ncbi:YihY/virulence factor BrkB family protein [Paenalkalicoccus suaedae]|uniref:YihY/virulence factor BrkB family protein n=1 Tax=Paenalkalicoccus suaedae TaxID=2592382 RepID=A0A859FBB9_9BACI|nr:YihY/virulence factor BrkB family protein [Paenalkalicoccus suaedae]QKS70092.1 YihY/virulence factor BrkB family protein [Paenalkalicoccus suaedae]
MVKSLSKRFMQHNLIDLGAQCAYFFLLSIFPFLLFSVSLLSFLPFSFVDIYVLLATYVPAGVLQVIESQWNVITNNQRTGILSLGAFFTLWTASLALNSILRSLNLAYDVTEDRGFVVDRLIALGLTFGMFFIIIMALLFQVVGSAVRDFFNLNLILFNFDILRWLLSSSIIFIVFLILYYIGPNIRLRFKEIYVGAIFATIGWQAVSWLFSYYLTGFANFSATYGTIGTVIALMVWFHLTSLIILLGGEINAILKDKWDGAKTT